MIKLKTKHLKTGEELTPSEILELIDVSQILKEERKRNSNKEYLKGKHIALLFDKPSLRTRFSFTVAINELGAHSVESVSQTRKTEAPEDLARVLSGYCHGIMIRTHEDVIIEKMAKASSVPIINGLSQLHHPCQVLADLMTLKENFSNLKGINLSYVGDGNNILHSLLLMAPCLGVNISYACPKQYQPNSLILKKANMRALESGSKIKKFSTPLDAVVNANAVYTDVWTSMGFEADQAEREEAFEGYQVNEDLLKLAEKNAVVMHCLPMSKGKEISETLPLKKNSVIFQQSENRLHIQKALLIGLINT